MTNSSKNTKSLSHLLCLEAIASIPKCSYIHNPAFSQPGGRWICLSIWSLYSMFQQLSELLLACFLHDGLKVTLIHRRYTAFGNSAITVSRNQLDKERNPVMKSIHSHLHTQTHEDTNFFPCQFTRQMLPQIGGWWWPHRNSGKLINLTLRSRKLALTLRYFRSQNRCHVWEVKRAHT